VPKTDPSSHRTKSKSSHSTDPPSIPSSPESTVFCLRSSDSSASQHRTSRRRRRPNPLPHRPSTQTTPTDYVNKLANLFTKSFSTPTPSSHQPITNEPHISTQTYDTISSPSKNLQSSSSPRHIQSPMNTVDMHSPLKEQV
jgi:hypothetical protein